MKKRELCGIYFRVKRNGKYENICFTDMTEIEQKRAIYDFSPDAEKLNEFGMTDRGYMEAEGIKVKNGTLYLGFASRKMEGKDDKRLANILIYRNK